MDITTLTIADLYATKAQAKEKESFYRSIRGITPDYEAAHKFWSDLLKKADTQLSNTLMTINVK